MANDIPENAVWFTSAVRRPRPPVRRRTVLRGVCSGRLVPAALGLVLSAGCAGMSSPAVAQMAPAGGAPVTTQQELSPDVQENLDLLTGPNALRARQIGARRLLQSSNPAAVAVLRQVLTGKPAPVVVQAVAGAVLEVKEPPADLVDPLVGALQTDQEEVRSAVVAALASCRNQGIAKKLYKVAADAGGSQPQRLAVIQVLSRLADRDAIEALINLLEAPDEPVRGAALAALNTMTSANFGPDVEQWRGWWQVNRDRKPIEWLADLNASLVKQNRDLSEQIKGLRARLVGTLQEAYHAAPEADRPKRLQAYLADPLADVRGLGLKLVNGLISDKGPGQVPPEVVAQLRAMIQDPEPPVRLQAVQVLRDLRNKEDAKLLLEGLDRETDPATAQEIVKALGRLGDPAALPALLERLHKPDPAMAAAAASALGLLCQRGGGPTPAKCDELVVDALIARCQAATDKALRQAILEAMQRIADERFREPLTAALASPDPALRQIAVRAFESLAGPDDADKTIPPLLGDAEPTVRETACRVLGRIGKSTHLPLLLQRADEQVETDVAVRRAARDAAVAILLRLEPQALRKALEGLMATRGEVAVVAEVLEAAMAQATGRGADPRVLAALMDYLAPAKYAAGQKDAAATLWARVVAIQPTPAAVASLAKVLLEVSNPDIVSGSIGQVAGGQSGALIEVINALAGQLRVARAPAESPGNGEALLAALARLDTSSWSEPNQQALKIFLGTHAAKGPTSVPAAPASEPTPASAPAPTAAVSPAAAPVSTAAPPGTAAPSPGSPASAPATTNN